MRPSQEVIEASRELHDLGVKKEPEEGDWTVLTNGRPYNIRNFEIGWAKKKVVIPPLGWCLEWLQRRRVKADLYCVDITDDQPMRWKVATFSGTMSSSPHLAVLKAMLAVKESDNGL